MALTIPGQKTTTFVVPGISVSKVHSIGSLILQGNKELAAEFIFDMWEEGGHVWIPIPHDVEFDNGNFKPVLLERFK